MIFRSAHAEEFFNTKRPGKSDDVSCRGGDYAKRILRLRSHVFTKRTFGISWAAVLLNPFFTSRIRKRIQLPDP
ncbi:hypothetical protein EAF00_005525 [Botryotinia globosa]|nr:hypothetical protein EAF00_005525 [Botryotinia globosa]